MRGVQPDQLLASQHSLQLHSVQQMKRHESFAMSLFTDSTVLETLIFASIVSQMHADVEGWVCNPRGYSKN